MTVLPPATLDRVSPIEAARDCLSAGGTLIQALKTLARVAAHRIGGDAYPLLCQEVFAAVKGRAPGHVASDTVLDGLTAEAQQEVLAALANSFPLAHDVLSSDYCAAAHRSASFLSAIDPETLPAVSVAGALTFAYLDPETRAVCVSVDLDSTWSELIRADGTAPLRITVGGMTLFDDSDQARAAGATVPTALPGIAGEFSPDELDCLVRTAGEAAGGGNALGDETLSRRQIALAERAYRLHLADFSGEDTPGAMISTSAAPGPRENSPATTRLDLTASHPQQDLQDRARQLQHDLVTAARDEHLKACLAAVAHRIRRCIPDAREISLELGLCKTPLCYTLHGEVLAIHDSERTVWHRDNEAQQ
ncbi:hypothetical protein GCM10010156_49680 [Planobispora rosea]|uniref:Uncharacterized protein n=1 Tax=Planobispora rosea TaxID=35762 RepID=A0A8J3WE03_PLARO|nr:hypothetical protein [Planobispora rosea]GGS85134.1 hypothetical protein GCM10010156_49680 [Planobispora rosea]GIH86479.1 hypothetical protein Pro02_48870 [Planobispora rosea]